jgi:amidase
VGPGRGDGEEDRPDGGADAHGSTAAAPQAPSSGDPHPRSLELAALGADALSTMLGHGQVSSVEVAEQLIARIEALDPGGAGLHCILEIAPDVLDVAASLDAERRAGRVRGPLHGIPVLVKDNIDTAAPLHTTAGSLVFGDCPPGGDATLVAALRGAGAIVLGKANLSEWANFRGTPSSSGWSAVGGQTRNPHVIDRSPGGSSSGSGAAVAARLAPLAVGTETDGSIICPSAACGIAGLKPTLGLVSRTGIVPIANSQDTAGPMARTARDIALLLEVLAGAVDDGEDDLARTVRRPIGYRTDYVALLGDGDLSGLRIGVVRGHGYVGYHPPTDRVFESMLEALASTGAEIVDAIDGLADPMQLSEDELTVLTTEFRVGAHAYFGRRASARPDCSHLPRTLEDVIAHAEAEPRERADLFGTDLIARAAQTAGVRWDTYVTARERNRRAAGTDGLDKLLRGARVDLLAAPAMQPAWPIDHVLGDHSMGGAWSASAVAGYPSATVPMGTVEGLPVGAALLGPPWSESVLLRAVFALEKALGPAVTSPVPRFEESLGVVD